MKNEKIIGYFTDGTNTIPPTMVLDINYGIDDTATVKTADGKKHTVKIYYNSNDSYIRVNNSRLYFKNCIRA